MGNATTVLSGKLFKDSELAYLPSGTAKTTFSLVTGNKYTNSAGKQVDDTVFYNVTIMGKRAEQANQLLIKGTVVSVTGKVKVNQFTRRDSTSGVSLELLTFEFDIISFADKNQATTQDAPVPQFESGTSSDAVKEDDLDW